MEGSADFDPKYFHRVAPYCVQDYDFEIDEVGRGMTMVYNVDLTDFRDMMRKEDPDFEYTESDYLEDFVSAYGKNCKIAAEAIGTAMELDTEEPVLLVSIKFKGGGEHTIPYARPDREVYRENANSVRASIAERLSHQGRNFPPMSELFPQDVMPQSA